MALSPVFWACGTQDCPPRDGGRLPKVTTPTACVETVNPILVAPVGKEKFVGEEAVAKGLALNT